MSARAKMAVRSKATIHVVKTKNLCVMPNEAGWLLKILRTGELDPHGMLPYDWTRRNG